MDSSTITQMVILVLQLHEGPVKIFPWQLSPNLHGCAHYCVMNICFWDCSNLKMPIHSKNDSLLLFVILISTFWKLQDLNYLYKSHYLVPSSTVESHFYGNGSNGISHLRNRIDGSQIFSGFYNVNFSRFNGSAFTEYSHLKALFSSPAKYFTPCLVVIWSLTLRGALAAFQARIINKIT